jgi:hypothetical protein
MGSVSAKTQAPTVAIVVHALFAIGLAITGTFEQLAVLSVLAGCTLYIGACLAAWRLTRQEVAMQGPPLRLPALGALAALGVVGNLAAIALARPAEIAGLIAAIAASCAVYWLTRGARARRA